MALPQPDNPAPVETSTTNQESSTRLEKPSGVTRRRFLRRLVTAGAVVLGLGNRNAHTEPTSADPAPAPVEAPPAGHPPSAEADEQSWDYGRGTSENSEMTAPKLAPKK